MKFLIILIPLAIYFIIAKTNIVTNIFGPVDGLAFAKGFIYILFGLSLFYFGKKLIFLAKSDVATAKVVRLEQEIMSTRERISGASSDNPQYRNVKVPYFYSVVTFMDKNGQFIETRLPNPAREQNVEYHPEDEVEIRYSKDDSKDIEVNNIAGILSAPIILIVMTGIFLGAILFAESMTNKMGKTIEKVNRLKSRQ